jgi:hypothetical protein
MDTSQRLLHGDGLTRTHSETAQVQKREHEGDKYDLLLLQLTILAGITALFITSLDVLFLSLIFLFHTVRLNILSFTTPDIVIPRYKHSPAV